MKANPDVAKGLPLPAIKLFPLAGSPTITTHSFSSSFCGNNLSTCGLEACSTRFLILVVSYYVEEQENGFFQKRKEQFRRTLRVGTFRKGYDIRQKEVEEGRTMGRGDI